MRISALDSFYDSFFKRTEKQMVMQVGANDGLMGDPLRKYLVAPSNNFHILVEPIPYYVEKLQQIYDKREDIKIVQMACGSQQEMKKLYFISPSVANEMGIENDWMHGQGSFDKNTVIYWINRNSFRGEKYIQKIPFLIESITDIEIPVTRIRDIPIPNDFNRINLLVIDVQGHELDVIKGIDWDRPPEYIVFEDDMGKGKPVAEYLISKRYIYVCGSTDRVFRLNDNIEGAIC